MLQAPNSRWQNDPLVGPSQEQLHAELIHAPLPLGDDPAVLFFLPSTATCAVARVRRLRAALQRKGDGQQVAAGFWRFWRRKTGEVHRPSAKGSVGAHGFERVQQSSRREAALLPLRHLGRVVRGEWGGCQFCYQRWLSLGIAVG